MSGLFVRRHAVAVQKYCDIKIVFVHQNKDMKSYEIVKKTDNGVEEIFIYYPVSRFRLINLFRYFYSYTRAFKELKKTNWQPDILHSNILAKNSLAAFFYRLFTGTPYMVTEHWSKYLPESGVKINIFSKFILKIIIKKAAAFTAVSTLLKQSIQNNGLNNNKNFQVVENVVEDIFFEKENVLPRVKRRIIYVSGFNENAKNFCGILNAVKVLSGKRNDFEVLALGSKDDEDYDLCYQHSQNLQLQDVVTFTGELSPVEVAHWIKQSDFCISFSNYETFGVVIAESLASGKPIISTPTGVAIDVINETNGLSVEFKDEAALSENMDYFLDNYHEYNALQISENAKKLFSYENIGRKFYETYKEILG
jgi:glycosyltransferase involved in cell wall biosynthesis